MAQDHRFPCTACEGRIESTLADVGRTIQCPQCQASVEVPRPRIRLSAGKPRAIGGAEATSNRSDQHESIARGSEGVQTIAGLAATANNGASASTPITATRFGNPETEANDSPAVLKAAATHSEAVSAEKSSELGIMHYIGTTLASVVLVVVLYYGSSLFNFDETRTLTREQITGQANLVLDQWHAADLSQSAIEDDLNITLKDLLANNLQDDALVVENAIAREKVKIDESLELAHTGLVSLAISWKHAPSATESAISDLQTELRKRRAEQTNLRLSVIMQLLYESDGDENALMQGLQQAWTEH